MNREYTSQPFRQSYVCESAAETGKTMRERDEKNGYEAGAPMELAPVQVQLQRSQELREEIARRAYEIFVHRGNEHGRDIDDWLQAESEVLHSYRHDRRESPEAITARAGSPVTFSADLAHCRHAQKSVNPSARRGEQLTAKKATQVLEEEHRIIQGVVDTLAVVGEEIEKQGVVSIEALRILGQFLEVFVRHCHQRKDAHLLSILEKKGVPAAGCPFEVLNQEHVMLDVLASQYVDSVGMYILTRGEAQISLAKTIHSLLELLPVHIWKEDNLLLPLADKVLTPGEQETLLLQFAQVESELGPGIHRAFEWLAEGLEEACQARRG